MLEAGATIPVDHALTLVARAWKPGVEPSGVATGSYVLDYGTLAPPVASPPGGTYSEPQLVTLTAAAGATIRYTLDGSQPTEASSVYTTPSTVSTTTTLQARAFRVDWTPSLSAVEILHARQRCHPADDHRHGEPGGERRRLAPQRRHGHLRVRRS